MAPNTADDGDGTLELRDLIKTDAGPAGPASGARGAVVAEGHQLVSAARLFHTAVHRR